MSTTEIEVQAVVAAFHRAATEGDAEGLNECLAETHVTWSAGPGNTNDPTIWKAGGFHRGGIEATRERIAKMKSYSVEVENLHVDVNEGENPDQAAAVVVVKETGEATAVDGKSHVWTNVINLWSLAKIDGRWKITGSMHHIGE